MGDQHNFQEPAPSRNGTRKELEGSDCDTLLPVQYYDRVAGGKNNPSGEFRLFFAILEDALRCYVRAKNCRTGSKRAEFVDARKWFFARGMPHVFSFESVCAFLGIDANWLRRRLESLTPSDLPQKQFHTRRRRLARLPAARKKCRPVSSTVVLVNGHDLSNNGHSLANGNGHNGNGHNGSNGHVSSGGGHQVSGE